VIEAVAGVDHPFGGHQRIEQGVDFTRAGHESARGWEGSADRGY
jgi:hypothetical protein